MNRTKTNAQARLEKIVTFIEKDREASRNKMRESVKRNAPVRAARARRAATIRKTKFERALPYAQRIWRWADKFRKSESGKKVIALLEPTSEEGVFFFDGDIPEFGAGTPGFGVNSRGLWWYPHGCGSEIQPVDSAEDLANVFLNEEPDDWEILFKEVCAWIKDGRVWQCVENRLPGKKRWPKF